MPKAPRLCPADGCVNLIRFTTYCDEHQREWPRHTRSPSSRRTGRRDWSALARMVLDRDGHECRIKIKGVCIGYATTVDHIRPVTQDGGDDPSNLRAACRPCNNRKGHTVDRRQPS